MKYSIGQIVKIKETREKVKIVGDDRMQITFLNKTRENEYYLHKRGWFKESELKPYCPSRTGTRDPKTGRFMSKYAYLADMPSSKIKMATFGFGTNIPNYKQRNYQKIEKMNEEWYGKDSWGRRVEDKINEIIDELGRRV